jgi:hypothetical protein
LTACKAACRETVTRDYDRQDNKYLTNEELSRGHFAVSGRSANLRGQERRQDSNERRKREIAFICATAALFMPQYPRAKLAEEKRRQIQEQMFVAGPQPLQNDR